MSKPAVGPIHSPTQWVPGALGGETAGCEAEHSSQFIAKVESMELHLRCHVFRMLYVSGFTIISLQNL